MICPLLSIGRHDTCDNCIEQRCAWWYLPKDTKGICAILALAMTISPLLVKEYEEGRDEGIRIRNHITLL